MAANILVVDDEQSIADLIEVYLKNENYNVFKFYYGRDALDCVESRNIDLAILDVMLPDIDGFSICRQIREKHTFPIIMLTAKEEEVDKITGLTLGADDYVTKPFKPLELVARVKAQLRRFTKYNLAEPAREGKLIAFAGLVLNKDNHECTLDERPLALTPTDFPSFGYWLPTAVVWSARKNCSRRCGAKSISPAAIIRSWFTSDTCGKNWVMMRSTPNTSKQFGG